MRMVPILLLLAGCTQIDPLTADGKWRPSQANDADLLAMLQNPADLRHGTAAPAQDGLQAAAAVARLRAGQVKPLPDSGIAELRVQPAGTPGAAPPTVGGGS